MSGDGMLCPVCSNYIYSNDINDHLDRCLLRTDVHRPAPPKKVKFDQSTCVLTRSAASKSQSLSQSTITSSTCQTHLPCSTSTSTPTSTPSPTSTPTPTSTPSPTSTPTSTPCPTSISTPTSTPTSTSTSTSTSTPRTSSEAKPSQSPQPPLSQSPAPSGMPLQSTSPARSSSQRCPTTLVSPSSFATTSRSKIANTKGISRDRTLLSMFQVNKEHSLVPVVEKNVGTDGLPSHPNTSTFLTSASVNSNVSISGRNNAQMDFKPLAERLRPQTLDDVIGQDKAFGANTLLRTLIEENEIPSIVFWGPPGCGKTSLAHVIANLCRRRGNARFVTHSATSATTANIREVIQQAQNEQRLCQRKTILFIDEIHRFNKSQQDTFLPHVENGTITLIGATTENPSFEINGALLSRCRVVVLEKLSVEAVEKILQRAVRSLGASIVKSAADEIEGELMHPEAAGKPIIHVEGQVLNTLAYLCDGDARVALNGLQMAVQSQVAACHRAEGSEQPLHPQSCSTVLIREEHAKEGLQRTHLLYDRAGEEHYNCISALHKSLRGSDANAGLYWLARMLEGGENPIFIARRLVRFASEDVGLADPMALTQAVAAFQGCHLIGMPECEVILAQCATYLARAEKSVEVYQAYAAAKACVREHEGPLPPVPIHLRNAPTALMKNLGYGVGYKYNPNFEGPVEQQYMPAELKSVKFF
uniref:ATPase WRNIP1 n=1 Tax=Myxine glutinosa TaxID=7769 RepID=UPI00358E35DB